MLTIRNLPLYWRFTDQKSFHRNIPCKIDFTFDIDQTLGMIIEKKDKLLLDILHNVYEEDANIGYMIDGHNLSQTYGEDYIRFLKKNVGSFSKKKIIDIGCGGCTLLEKLKSEGANVLGIDPSPVANREAKRKKIPLNETDMIEYYKELNKLIEDYNLTEISINSFIQENLKDKVNFLSSNNKKIESQYYNEVHMGLYLSALITLQLK